MTTTEEYEVYRRRERARGRASYWAFLAMGVIGVTYAVVRGVESGFSGGEIGFIILFGLFVVFNAVLLSPIYRLLADAMVRRRQSLRGDPVDKDDAAPLHFGDEGRIDNVLLDEESAVKPAEKPSP